MPVSITVRSKNQHVITLTDVNGNTWSRLESDLLKWAEINHPDYQDGRTALGVLRTEPRVWSAQQAHAIRLMLLDLYETEPGRRPANGHRDQLAYDIGQILDCLTDDSQVDITET